MLHKTIPKIGFIFTNTNNFFLDLVLHNYIVTVAKGGQFHIIIAKVAFAARVTNANVGVFVAKGPVGLRLHIASSSLLASLCDADLAVFLAKFCHANLREKVSVPFMSHRLY